MKAKLIARMVPVHIDALAEAPQQGPSVDLARNQWKHPCRDGGHE